MARLCLVHVGSVGGLRHPLRARLGAGGLGDRRPDAIAAHKDKFVTAGQLLFVLKEKREFAQVNYPRSVWSGSEAWVFSSKLNRDDKEISASKLLGQIIHLRAQKDDESQKQLETLEGIFDSGYAGTKLKEILDKGKAEAAAENGDQPAEP